MMDMEYQELLAQVVNSKRLKALPFDRSEGLADQFRSYERLSDLPPSLLAEFQACLASGPWQLGDPLFVEQT